MTEGQRSTMPSPSPAAGPKPTPASKSSASSDPDRAEARSFWLFVAMSLVLAAAILIGLAVGVGVDLDAPTFALAAACVVMVWALRAMWGIVVALARPVVETILVEAETVGVAASDIAELREEKRRVLRAIKELEFDHAMGKLSAEDFKQIGDRYRMRAIEVIRELEPSAGGADIHPVLAEHLAALGIDPRALGSRALDRSGQAGQPAQPASTAESTSP